MIGIPYLKKEKLVRFTIFPLNVLDRIEINIQAFVDVINGKLMSCHSSSSTFHDFKISSFLNIRSSGILNFKNSKRDS